MIPSARFFALLFVTFSTVLAAGTDAFAAEAKTIDVELKGDVFTPNEIKIPVGESVVVKFRNLNPGPAEIESKPLKIEKVVKGGGEIVANVKAKAAGRFLFVNEYREDVAKGYFVAE